MKLVNCEQQLCDVKTVKNYT